MKPLATILFSLLLAGIMALPAFAGSSSFAYCNPPFDLPTNPYSSRMDLVQLQLVTRHGDRTPGLRLDVDPVDWVCELRGTESLNTNPLVPVDHTYPTFELPPSCLPNQLTIEGRDEHVELGTMFRRKYVDDLGFLPGALSSEDLEKFFVRSTDIPRTIQSAQAFLIGLYPPYPNGFRPGDPLVNILTRYGEPLPTTVPPATPENIQPNSEGCPALANLSNGFFSSPEAVSVLVSNLPLITSVANALNIPIDPDPAKAVPGVARTLNAMDNLYGRVCHDLPLPTGITEAQVVAMRDVQNQFQAGPWTYQAGFPQAVSLGIGTLLGDIQSRLREAATGAPTVRMALYSGHDTTFWPLLTTLGQPNAVTIPYATHIAFELWQDRWRNFWVAIDFNGNYLAVPGCGGPLCRLADFEQAIARFVPTDFEQECMASGSESRDRSPVFDAWQSLITER